MLHLAHPKFGIQFGLSTEKQIASAVDGGNIDKSAYGLKPNERYIPRSKRQI
jgi:hypothetical protein